MKYAAAFSLALVPMTPAIGSDDLRPSYAGPSAAQQRQSDASPWSRPYVGLYGGVGSGETKFTSNAGDEVSFTSGGLIGGLRAGYDYEVGGALVGIMADYGLTNIGSEVRGEISGLGDAEANSALTSLATLRARVGATHKNMLLYLHGGAALGTVELKVNDDDIAGVIDNPRFGFAVGAGMEYAIGHNATFQTEYSYVDFGKQDIYSEGSYTLADDLSVHMITSGVMLRF